MEVALGSVTSLLRKVLTTLSDSLVAAYVDSLQLGHNTDQIRDKLLHTQALLHNAHGSHVGDNPGLQGLLEKLSREADQAEDLLDEVHYFQIHDKLHGTNYAATQDLDGVVRHQALHAGSAVRHTLGSWFQCFSCSRTPKTKRDGGDDDVAAVAGAPRRVTNTLGTLPQCFSCSCTPKRNGGDDDAAAAVAGVGGDTAAAAVAGVGGDTAAAAVAGVGGETAAAAVAGVTNSNSASADNGDTLHFDTESMLLSLLQQGMESHCDSVSNLLGTIPSSSMNGGDDDAAAAIAGVGGDTAAAAVAGVTNSNSASADDGDTLHFDRVSMSSKIKSLLQDMQSLCDSVSDLLGTIPSSSTTLVLNRPQTASMIKQDTLYGRRGTSKETIKRITDTGATHTVSVLPIVGPGGIGKTTFATHLYNDARTQDHFQVRVWVCVSTDFDVVKLTREILGCIPATEEGGSSGVANETTNLDQLQQSIAHRLKSKRFLIVLDDIWKCDSQDQWKTLLAPFTKGEAKGSMVLVTTRFPKVADMVKTVDPLELRGLESNDFFTFFEACIFGEDKPKKYEDELAGIARKIANRLKGSPLAAKTVGRLLQKDLSQEHWNGVLEKHQWLKQQDDDDIMQSLKISYDCLPFYLKKCFSYCGLFPEDHEFTSSEINHFWVAIGIIDSNHQDDRNYLEELVDNGFLMKKSNHGRDRYCYVMHDLMHELSKSVSAQECLNISGLDFRADAIPQSVRHLSIDIEDRYDANFEQEMCKLRERIDIANLRSLMIFREYEDKRIAKLLKDSFKEINSLRVLFIVVKSAQSFPYKFSKLIHLQYLKITSYYYSDREMSLPSTLSRFYHLKFLDLDGWRGSSDLPEDFSHLENLHDFRGRSELHSNIRNVGKMKHLQRLGEFHVRKGSMGFELSELGALTELEGGLIIRGLEHVANKEEATAAKLLLKKNLKDVTLLWGRDQPTTDADILDALRPHSNLRELTIVNHGGTVGPSWLCLDIRLTSLETLTLEGVSWSTLPPFGELPNLEQLKLKKISGMHQFGLRCGGAPGKCFMRLKTVEFYKISGMRQFGPCCGGASGKCFMRLKEVKFYEMPELAKWVVEPNCHSFPSLEKIECIDCRNLCVMPFSEVCCTNLRRLEVSGCPKMSLPSMPHTSTLTDLVVKRGHSETLLSYDGKKLVVSGYGGALAFHNMDKVKYMFFERCYEECVMQFPSSSSLQELTFWGCKRLVLVPVENGGGIQEDNSLLQSITIYECGKLFSQWPMGESETICPFPASLRKLYVWGEQSMKSMALLSNLTSLISLWLEDCSNLTVDGFNPLMAVNLINLQVYNCNTLAADMLSEVASQRAKLLPAGYISRLEKLNVDDICGLLVAPICSLLAPALHTLEFKADERMESLTEEQEKALQLLTSLQKLEFYQCERLQSLPQGLHRLSSLKELCVFNCPEIRSMPKEGLPVSLRELEMDCRSAEIDEQIKKIKRTNPGLCVWDDSYVSDSYTED